MTYFVTTDIHGHYDELIQALNDNGFDSNNEDHHLILLGDLFDRGEQNLKVLRFVHDLLKRNKVTLIMGNHDEFFFYPENYIFHFTYNGFGQTLNEFYGGVPKSLDAIYERTPELKEVLDAMKPSVQIGEYVFLHSGMDEDGKPAIWARTPDWIKSGRNDHDGKTYVFGHWFAFDLYKRFYGKNVRKNSPFIYKNYIGLDSGVVLYKELFIHKIKI